MTFEVINQDQFDHYNEHGYLTLQGRRGGSAMASAAVNALAGGLE